MRKLRLSLVILALLICILPASAAENTIFSDDFSTNTVSEYNSNGPSLLWNDADETLSITGNGWKSVEKNITSDTTGSGKVVIEYSVKTSTSNKAFNFGVMVNDQEVYSSDIKNLTGTVLRAVIDKDNGTYTVYDENENIKSAAKSIPAGYPLQGFCLNMGSGSEITFNHIRIYTLERHTEDIFFLDDFLTNTTAQYVSHGPSLSWNENDKSLTITGNGWKAVDKTITSDTKDFGKVVIEFSIKTSTQNKSFNFGVMVNNSIVYSSDIKNLTGTTLYAVIDKNNGSYTVYDENENIKSATIAIDAGYPLQGFCLNMGTGSVITFDYIKAYYAEESARKDLYFDDFSNASGAIAIQPQRAQLTIENGVATIFAKNLANPKVVIPAFPADGDSLIIEFRVKKISGGTVRFYLDNANTEIRLLDVPSCYEWTVFNLLFDFANSYVKVYKDGILYDTIEFTYTNRSELSPRMAHSINGNGVMYDYFKSYYPAKPTLKISEKTVAKVVLKSDTPISDAEINTISVDDAQIKSIKRRYMDEIIITFEEPLDDSKEYMIRTNGTKDIFGNSFDGKIALSFSDKITVNSLLCETGEETTAVTGKITNDNFTSKQVELIVCAYSNNKLVSMKKRELHLQHGNNDISETFEIGGNVTVKCFVWSSLDDMIMID